MAHFARNHRLDLCDEDFERGVFPQLVSLHILRIDPAPRRFLRQARFDLHPIGQKFFDVKIAGAKEKIALPVAQQVNLDAVDAGR